MGRSSGARIAAANRQIPPGVTYLGFARRDLASLHRLPGAAL